MAKGGAAQLKRFVLAEMVLSFWLLANLVAD
jgi:hypothetical protein